MTVLTLKERNYNSGATFMTNFEKVKEFMTMMGQEIKPEPELPRSLGTLELRLALIDEEFGELREAIINDDIIEAADGLADILYVVYGAAAAFGIDIDDVFDEVHDSNMSKLGEDNKPIYNDQGKVMKGPHYFRPNIARVLQDQELLV